MKNELKFKDKLKIEMVFNLWCETNGKFGLEKEITQIAKTPFNMICFLQIYGLLDEKKALQWLNKVTKRKEEGKNDKGRSRKKN